MDAFNPTGLKGFDFLEFCAAEPNILTKQFNGLGFTLTAKHVACDIDLYQQHGTRFLINKTLGSQASQFIKQHGAGVCAMGFRVHDAKAAYQYALAQGAIAYEPAFSDQNWYNAPAIQGVDGSLIYFIEYQNNLSSYAKYFSNMNLPITLYHSHGLTYIDHVTHNLYRGNMDKWADFYMRVFNFKEVRYFDIEGKLTGLKSRAMASPCGMIRIPLNESSDDKSQIEEFLKEFNGEGIQHIALGTDNIYETVSWLREQQVAFLDTPDTYYELIEERLPSHGEPIKQLKKQRILIDGNTKEAKKILLQIFTKNMVGPVFFEIIQRKGDEGFGEGNFRALFESIELDQIRRGVLEEVR